MRTPIVMVVALALLTVPPTTAQSDATPTTLYFHVFNTFDKFPINTQPMDVDYFEVGGTNFPTWEAQGWDFNTIYGYSTAGPVEYDFIENGRPRFHPEHGIAADVEISDSMQPTAYFYIDVRDVMGSDDAPMVLPYYTVDVTVRTGDDPGDTAQLDAGELLMSGSMTAHMADSTTGDVNALGNNQSLDDVPVLTPDADGIIEFAIPLEVAQSTIPKKDAYNIRIDWYQDRDGAIGKDAMATGWLRLAADQQHLPRIEMAVDNPVYVEFIHPQVAAGTLLIHTGVNSPWGTYDVDVDNMSLTIQDKAGNIVASHDGSDSADLERFVAQGAHVHGLHDQAAEVSYIWDFREAGVPDGEYTIALEVANLRGNAQTSETALFVVEGKKAFGQDEDGKLVEPTLDAGPEEKSPGAGLLIIPALAALGRRRI